MVDTLYNIPFRRYFQPDGRSVLVNFTTLRPVVHDKARQIIDAGFHFEFEVLSTGHGSYTIGDEHGDYAHALDPNHTESTKLPERVENIILNTSIAYLEEASEEAK